jgi:hypothetical protein
MKYHERSKLKINVLMSKQVRTRTSHQCHSHHQKMIKKFGSLTSLIEFTLGIHQTKVKSKDECGRELQLLDIKDAPCPRTLH